jgi:hypothetical protein
MTILNQIVRLMKMIECLMMIGMRKRVKMI